MIAAADITRAHAIMIQWSDADEAWVSTLTPRFWPQPTVGDASLARDATLSGVLQATLGFAEPDALVRPGHCRANLAGGRP